MSSAKLFYEDFNFEEYFCEENENISPNQQQGIGSLGSVPKTNKENSVPSAEVQASTKHIEVWSEGDTKILLDKYYEFLNCVGPLKRFRNKKLMWMAIAHIVGKTWKQCEQRYKTVLRRKKTSVENNRKSGSSRVNEEYGDELRKIATIDDSVEPEIQISSQNMIQKETESSLPSSSSFIENLIKKKKKSVQETLIEIFEKKEAARERRHREKIEKSDALHELLEKLIEKNQ